MIKSSALYTCSLPSLELPGIGHCLPPGRGTPRRNPGKLSGYARFRGPASRVAGCAGGGSGARRGDLAARCPKLVIDCARSGKDRVKDFVISFTSSPSTADERPVIPFLNLTGYPQRSSDAATGSCLARGTFSRVVPPRGGPEGSALRIRTDAVELPGAL